MNKAIEALEIAMAENFKEMKILSLEYIRDPLDGRANLIKTRFHKLQRENFELEKLLDKLIETGE